jgi:DNA-directed RNA polymerase subunit RPC12/RpoP
MMQASEVKFKNVQIANGSCKLRKLHTKMPEGYVHFAETADELIKTHRNIQCPGCGFYVLWVLKDGRKGVLK